MPESDRSCVRSSILHDEFCDCNAVYVVYERKVNFHPDDMFEDYVSCEGGINTFTIDECAIYNRLMDECFRVCDNEGVDIYSIGLKELQTALGINVA